MAKKPSISVPNSRWGMRIIQPPENKPRAWQIAWTDPVTGKPRRTSATSLEAAQLKAARLMGDFVPEAGPLRDEQPPTFGEVFEAWIDANQYRWSMRTVVNYRYCAKRFLRSLGQKLITAVTPKDLAAIDISGLSVNQQQKTRTLIRGIFTHATMWIKRDVEIYAKAVRITGTKDAQPDMEVSRGDIAPAYLVGGLILCAYSTLQPCPIEQFEPAKSIIKGQQDFPDDVSPWSFYAGLPESIALKHARGIPDHYAPETKLRRAQEEREEIAGLWRRTGLIMALGAGGALRIGEIMALRVRHFLPTEADVRREVALNFGTPWQNTVRNYRGRVHIWEQASQLSSGKIWLSKPKGKQGRRTMWLPAFLANWFPGRQLTTSEALASFSPHFEHHIPGVTQWNADEEDSLMMWANGYTPLGYLLWQRLEELWASEVIQSISSKKKRIEAYQRLLLFPTRNQAKLDRDGLPNVLFEAGGWKADATIVPGTGTYQLIPNFTLRWANPLYDYVGETLGLYPAHRINRPGRKGWTHHSLRHYAITTMITQGIPLPQIAKLVGHADAGFTLKRYGHAVEEDLKFQGLTL